MKFALSAALGVCILALPAAAQAAENLDCAVAIGSDADTAKLDRYVEEFSSETFDDDLMSQGVIEVLADRVEACAAENSWSDQASEMAFLYSMSLLNERGMRQSAPIAADILRQIDNDIPASERDRFWSIAQKIAGDITDLGEAVMPADDDIVFLGEILERLNPGGSESTDEDVGALMTMIILKRQSKDLFANF